MYGRLGQKAVFDMFECELVDEKYANNETYSLYKSKEIEPMVEDRLAWVRVVCPSTGTPYLLGVEPHHTDAHEAAASTFGRTKNDYLISQHT